MPLDPCRKGVEELYQEVTGGLILQVPALVEQLPGAPDIGLGLRHCRYTQADKRLSKVMICAEPADSAGRDADDCAGFPSPDALAVRP